MKRKQLAAIVALVLLLCAGVGGTLAWITAQTPAVTNTFTPATVTTDIEENFDGTTKSNIKVTNPSDPDTNIPVYIRVAVVVNWVDENDATKIVPGPAINLPEAVSPWDLADDGYYYYTSVVDPGDSTSSLFGEAVITEPSNKPDGARLQVTILAEAIQAQGGAVQNAWPGAPITNS